MQSSPRPSRRQRRTVRAAMPFAASPTPIAPTRPRGPARGPYCSGPPRPPPARPKMRRGWPRGPWPSCAARLGLPHLERAAILCPVLAAQAPGHQLDTFSPSECGGLVRLRERRGQDWLERTDCPWGVDRAVEHPGSGDDTATYEVRISAELPDGVVPRRKDANPSRRTRAFATMPLTPTACTTCSSPGGRQSKGGCR